MKVLHRSVPEADFCGKLQKVLLRADGAKAAYSFTPSCSFSALWFNESADDPSVMSPVAEVLDPKEVLALSKEQGELVLLDVA